MLSIRLFGAPQITHNDEPVTITRRKSRALIYYLAAHATPLTRDHLLAFFWPDHDRQGGLQNLRTTLYGLRKVLDSLLQVEDDNLALADSTAVDAHTFADALAAPHASLENLKETVDLYRGDFLDGFTLPDLPEFDDWILVERERYRRLAITGLTRLSRAYEEAEAFRPALGALDEALAFDPLQEDLQRLALRLHYAAGDRAGAIRRFEHFSELLADEMGVPPMDETQALYDAIITDRLELAPRNPVSHHNGHPAEATVPQPNASANPAEAASQFVMADMPQRRPRLTAQTLPFAGRALELERLHELVGTHRLVLIQGESGIGKSRLIEQFIDMQPQPRLVLTGQARELESGLPYHPFVDALRSALSDPHWPSCQESLNLATVWRVEAARLLPEIAPAEDAGGAATGAMDEIRLWEGVSQLILALARHFPLILALDDLQWADSSTLGMLGYLMRKAAHSDAPITFLAAATVVGRSSPLATFLSSLTRENRLERLPLERLPDAEIALLAQQVSPGDRAPLADWLNVRSEGNPFILAALVRYAQENLRRPDGSFDLSELPDTPLVPPTVFSLIQARLARLNEAEREILNTAVAIGREFEFDVVAHAVSLSDDVVLDSLDMLENRGLIEPMSGTHYRFDHHLTLAVARQAVSEPRHRLFHRRVAGAMEQVYAHRLDSVAGLLAHHFGEGGVPDKATHYAFRAGQLATDLAAWNESIAFFESALATSQLHADAGERQEILAALGQAHLRAGHTAGATEALQAALALAHQGESRVPRTLLYMQLSRALIISNRFDELLTLAEDARATLRGDEVPTGVFLYGSALSHSRGDMEGAIAHVQQAMSMLRQMEGDPAFGTITLDQILFELGNILARQGDISTAVQHFRDGLEFTRRMDCNESLQSHVLFYNNLAYHLHLLHDPSAAQYAHDGLALAQEKGVLSEQPYLFSTLGEIALAAGDLADAQAYFQEGLSLAHQFSNLERVAGLTANLGLVARNQGQRAGAIEHLFDALGQADVLNLPFLATRIRLWLAPLLPPEEAQTHLATALRTAQHDGYEHLHAQAVELSATLESSAATP